MRKWFVVCVEDDRVSVMLAKEKPVYHADIKSYGTARKCFTDGTDGEDMDFATGFIAGAVGVLKDEESVADVS